MKQCAFCNKTLPQYDENTFNPMAFHIMCSEHLEYATIYNIEVLKKEMGLLTVDDYPERLKKCDICEQKLTPEEVDGISKNDFLTTCYSHRDAKNMYQVSVAKQWFEFKGLHMYIKPDSEEWRKKFTEWRIEKSKNK